jgi:hypothetical protein
LLAGEGEMLLITCTKFSRFRNGKDINPAAAHPFGDSIWDVFIKVKPDRRAHEVP